MKVDTILVNRYQIREQLSQKNGRRTFLAQDLQSQDVVIVKILRFDVDFEWDDLKLFEREASTLKNLNHPAIPRYLDYFDVEEPDTRGFALVQTYIDAPSLETVVRKGRKFSEAEVIELADRILTILAYLHNQIPSVIHRDIKPSNILIGDRSGNSVGKIYLVDFGSVQTFASKDRGTITIVGSDGYIPLEQFSGQTTTASDLYSLGMTIIYLLTGTHPTELEKVNGRVKFTAKISSRFHRWIEKITHPFLDKRFDSVKSAQIALASDDGSYGDFIHLKPANTKISLYRDSEKIEIMFNDLHHEKIERIINTLTYTFVGLSIISAISFVIMPLLGTWGIYLFLFALPFTVFIGFIMIPIGMLISKFKHLIGRINYKLAIDSKYIYHYIYLGEQHKFKVLSKRLRSQIKTLVYNPGYTFDRFLDGEGKLVRGVNITVPHQLYLCGINLEYHIQDSLSQAEAWWLGKELSDFLNLDLQVTYTTPRFPPPGFTIHDDSHGGGI
jgi:serine/threonine protein kinase